MEEKDTCRQVDVICGRRLELIGGILLVIEKRFSGVECETNVP